jgi:hypothetical protein
LHVFVLFLDTPVEFLAKLTEQFVEENQECIFTCVVDREDVIDEKKTHTLVIKNSDHSDIGEYTVVVGDSRSSAKLNLDGKFSWNHLWWYMQ